MTHFALQGKTALVTGAAKGIGLAVAKRFREAGADVILADLADASSQAAEIGGQFLQLNVADEKAVACAFEHPLIAERGLDILVNNAGIVPKDNFVMTTEGDQDSLRQVFEVNTYSVFYGLKHGPAVMNDGASIINTASLAAHLAVPGNSQYSATKAAVVQLTRTSAVELGPRGIRVNVICPSFLRTDMGDSDLGIAMCEELTAIGRIGELDDIVGIYHFLAADESAFISGQVFTIDGGWSAGISMPVMQRMLGN